MKDRPYIAPGRQGAVYHYGRVPHTRQPHWHDELEVNLVISGAGHCIINGEPCALAPGTLLWLFPGQPHVLPDQSDGFEMWVVYYRRPFVHGLCTTESTRPLWRPDPGRILFRRIIDDHAALLAAVFRNLCYSASDPALFNAGLGHSLLLAWAAHSAIDRPAADGLHPAVEKAAQLMRDEADAVNVEQLARRCGLSPAHLSRLFKRQIGMSLVNYRQRQAMERFVRLYGDGRRRTLVAAALEAGFGSYPQFHRVFRRIMGCAPAVYRQVAMGARSTGARLQP